MLRRIIKMNILIPMAGLGYRFQKEGYLCPKPLVKVRGKPILQYLLDCLFPINNEIIYITYVKPLDIQYLLICKFKTIEIYDDLENCIDVIKGNGVGTCKCIELLFPTKGATETLYISTKIMNQDAPLVSFDCDNFYCGDVLSRLRNLKNSTICYFNDEQKNPIYSYIKINDENSVIEIVEKNKISNMACSGIYYFSNTKEIKIIAENILKKYNFAEIYISEIYKNLIQNNRIINCLLEPPISLGTPLAVENVYHSGILEKERLTYCFDLDGTLVSFSSSYEDVKPINQTIEFLRYLKAEGNKIIIYTARGMKSRNGDLKKIEEEVKPCILETLKKFDIPYDELILGKPFADFYIDDKAISIFSNLQKETGNYNKLVSPNCSHTVDLVENQIVKKGDLKGEKWWYDHIPEQIKHLFPKMDSKSTNEKLILEKIKGITFSQKYIFGTLNVDHLENLFSTLKNLHEIPSNKIENVKEKYIYNLKKRYEKFPDFLKVKSKNLYLELLRRLKMYEGVSSCVIHGDPVFTNVLLTSTNTIMLIDMRGKLGEVLTIYGDPIYDYSKIYQSILGYDFILHNHRPLSTFEQDRLILKFEVKMKDRIREIYLITAFLFFTLIPLHLNEAKEQLEEYYKMSVRLLNKLI